ncbi:Amino acid transporter transmembrane domain [Arabidopsis suecica]|uniref:Amino acid transporter transmembrane domain n=1 Tax=Arabidopsis suecica TaxID=45249 RepID=A0A8T1ZT45_ARASU|nr:Amino acid transporter transmembrane domain [Arabidopsis suecica]KAG7563979.1 Amino acid transporter transmembrane domain [Arabidopsis suecica]
MEEDNQERQRDNVGTSSFFKTCFNALNALSGIGILSVPYSLARGGWLSLSLLLLLAATAFYTSILITKCMNADRNIKTYPDIGERAFGRAGRIIVSLFMHLELYLVTTGFLILEGDNLHNLFPGFNIEMIGLRLNGKQAFMATVALVIMPTLWWDNLSVLSYVSMSGVLATTVTLGSISWVGAFDGIGFHQKGKLINWSGIPTALSLYAFCYGAHPVLPTLYSSMKSKHQFNNVLLICFILCTIGYTSMAVLGYLMYGSQTLSQITLNLPIHKTSSKVAIYTTLVNPVAKYALMITPTVNTIKDWFPSRYAKKTYLHLLISTFFIISSVVIAETLPFFGYMMSLVGALLSVTVSILLPCLCYLKIYGNYKKIGCETIMLFGMVVMSLFVGVLGTYIAIREIIGSV